jgi:cell division protein FtsB
MRERNTKKTLPDLIFSKFFVVFCLFIFIFIIFSLAKGTIKNYKVNSEIEQLRKEIVQLDKQNQEFGQLINYLNSDTFIEQEAKLKLGLKKEGENLVIIPEKELNVEKKAAMQEQNLSNPARWWSYFFK